MRPDAAEVEQLFHEGCVVGHRVDGLDDHPADLRFTKTVEIHIRELGNAVLRYRTAPAEDRFGDVGGSRSAIRHIVFDAKVAVRAAGIVAGRKHDAAGRAPLADHAGQRGRGQEAALSHDHPRVAMGGGHLQDGLDRRPVVIAPVAAQHDDAAGLGSDRVEERLDEIFEIVGLLKDPHLLPQPRGSRALVVKRRSCDPQRVHCLPTHGAFGAVYPIG
jgi:hypothetical protein